MALTKTPICEFGKKAENFQLNSTKNEIILLSVDFNWKVSAFFPKSHIGVFVSDMLSII